MSYVSYRKECEEALVGIAFIDPLEAIDKVLSKVAPSDFEDRDLGIVYEVLRDLHAAGLRLDHDTVFAEMQKRGVLERIGKRNLKDILARSYAISNASHYASEVARLADHRRVIHAAERILATREATDAVPEELVRKFEVESRLERGTDEASTLSECVELMVRAHQKAQAEGNMLGLPTGFPTIDRKTSGLHRGSLWIIGARSGTGKTALSLSIANALASRGRGVVFFSLEMTKTELAERTVADEIGINFSRICFSELKDSDYAKIQAELPRFNGFPFVVLDRPSQTVAEIKAKAKVYAPDSGLDLIVVDTLQRVRPSHRQERRLELKQITEDLKDAAKELNCAVILCAQLNADAEGKEPDVSHLSESKQVIEPADTCLLLHREDPRSESVLVKVEKVRRGPRNRFYMNFDGKFQRFTDPGQTDSEPDENEGLSEWEKGWRSFEDQPGVEAL